MSVEFLNEEEIELLIAALPTLARAEQEELLHELELLEKKRRIARAKVDFLEFCHYVYPGFKEGPHHRHLRPLLHELRDGTKPRLTVSMPPRFGKSETIAYLFVSWYLGHNPNHQIMMATHTADLSADFGRKVRNMLDSDIYHEIFPDTVVARDKSAASNWSTTKGGKYLAIGIGANVAGHGADLLIGDDLVSEQAVLSSDPDKTFAQAWEYMQVGPLQRLMPGGRIIMIGTRWGKKDPIGRALAWAENNPDSLPWHEVRFPALLPSGKSLWPEQWPVEQLMAKKAGMFPQFWAAQYMQEPTSEEGALVKREWWKVWPKEKPPACEIILQSWDTAHETKTASDPSMCLTWGIFYNEETSRDEIILLDMWKGRKAFPDLKKFALETFQDWEPDIVLIEKKAAGAPLIQELRAIGVPVQEYTPSRGADKRVRINAVADIFASGMVWRPDTRWAQEVVDEVAEFPNGEHDEAVDCFVVGTKVRMADGTEQTIERVQAGDMVATPLGPKPVVAAWSSGVFPVWEVSAGGKTLTGTRNHPFFTGEGWTVLDKLREGEQTVYFYQGVSEWPLDLQACVLSPVTSTGISTTGIRKQKRKCTGTTLHVPENCCTAPFGSSTMGRYQQDTTYTTRTEIRETTTSVTLSALRPRNTVRSILQKLPLRLAPRNIWHILQRFVIRRLRGTSPLQAWHGINSTQAPTTQKREPLLQNEAGTVKSPTPAAGAVLRGLQKTPEKVSAPQNVSPPNRGSAPVSLVRNTHTMQEVFNLEVADAQCYFANDFLVHNCTSQALMRFRQGGLIRLESDEWKDGERVEPRRASYY